jgi:hypothetical protein
MAEPGEQVIVGVREAAQIAEVSTKQVRKWIAEHRVRADLQAGKFGPTWAIEASSLPLPRRPMEPRRVGVGQGQQGEEGGLSKGADTVAKGAVEALLAMLADLQRRHEGAVARLGQLEGEREQRLALEERARSLVESEALARAEAEGQRRSMEAARERAERLGVETETLRQSLRLRTWAALIGVFAALLALGALLAMLLGRQ